MSTATSTDVNVTRPTTRLSNPPGGRSTISFGDAPPSPRKEKAAETAPPPPASPTPEPLSSFMTKQLTPLPLSLSVSADEGIATAFEQMSISGGKVGVAVVRTDGYQSLKKAIVDSLGNMGASARVVEVDDLLMLPFVTQRLTESCEAVIAMGVVVGENTSIDAVVGSLFTVGAIARTPVIPGIVSAASFDINLASTWASAACSLVAMKTSIVVEEIGPGKVTRQTPVPVSLMERLEIAAVDLPATLTTTEVPSTPNASAALVQATESKETAKESAAATAKKSQQSGIFAPADTSAPQSINPARGRGKPQGSSIVFG